MPKSKSRKKKPPKRVLALPDLEHAKTAVLNSLTSAWNLTATEASLRTIAEQSGGFAIFEGDNLPAALQRISNSMRE